MNELSFQRIFFCEETSLKRCLRRKVYSRRGFTLLEMIMVIVLLAIMGISASTRLENVSDTKAQLTTQKITSDVRYAQMLAIQTQQRTRIAFDLSSVPRTMSLLIEESPGNWTALKNPLTKADYIVSFNTGDYAGVLLTGVSLNSSNNLVFDSLGRPYDLAGAALNDPASIQFNSNFNLQIESETGKVTP